MRRLVVGLATTLMVYGGLGSAPAQAAPQKDGTLQWCPGRNPYLKGMYLMDYAWDTTVCHTCYLVGYNLGNVPHKDGSPSRVWDGDNPPAMPPSQPCPFPPWCP